MRVVRSCEMRQQSKASRIAAEARREAGRQRGEAIRFADSVVVVVVEALWAIGPCDVRDVDCGTVDCLIADCVTVDCVTVDSVTVDRLPVDCLTRSPDCRLKNTPCA